MEGNLSINGSPRQYSITLFLARAACDLASSLACVLTLMRDPPSPANFITLYQGFDFMLRAVVNNQVLNGEVPLPIFQICASIRSRAVKLGRGRVITLHTALDSTSPDGLPTPGGSANQFTYMVEKLSGLSCAKINLSRLGEVGSSTIKGMKVTYGETTGPLNFMTSGGLNTTISTLQSDWHQSEAWMRYLGWAKDLGPDFGGGFEIQTKQIIIPYPLVSKANSWSPGRAVLTQALQNYSIFSVSEIDFIPFDLGKYTAYFLYHLLSIPGTLLVWSQDLYLACAKFALVGYSRIGLCAGQTDYINPYLEKSRYSIPLPLMESAMAPATFRETMRLPYVLVYQNPFTVNDTESNMTYTTSGGVLKADFFASTTTEGDFPVPLGTAPVLSNNYNVISTNNEPFVNRRILNFNEVSAPQANPITLDDNVFNIALEYCPTAKASSDKSVGKLSLVDVTSVPRFLVNSGTNNSIEFSESLSTESKGVLSEPSQVAFFTNLCLPYDTLFTNITGTGSEKRPYSFSQTLARDNTTLSVNEMLETYSNSFIQRAQYRKTTELAALEKLIDFGGGAGSVVGKLLGLFSQGLQIGATATGFGAVTPLIKAGEHLIFDRYIGDNGAGKKQKYVRPQRRVREGNISSLETPVVSSGRRRGPVAQPSQTRKRRPGPGLVPAKTSSFRSRGRL